MSSEALIAQKYARAVLQLAQIRKCADQVVHELELARQLFGQGDGRVILVHPLLPKAKKIECLRELLQGKVLPLVLELLILLVEKRRGVLVSAIAIAYQSEWLALQNRKHAVVTSAIPLEPGQLEQLRKRLQAIFQQEVDVEENVDPSLRAGARVILGDLVLDGTLTGRMDRLRRSLTVEN